MALHFFLALLPLIAVLVGIMYLKQSGAKMAVVGLALVIIISMVFFDTPLNVALGSSAYGLIKSFGITIAVLCTMMMVLIMKEAGALTTISSAINRISATPEEQSLFIGVGLGSFLTSLGVVTPALFPPLLVAMGFSAVSAVVISVLGYNATTSYALLAIPITLPADIGKIDPFAFSYKISLFLPVVSVGLALAILWVVGGKKSVRKGWVPAVLCGLSIAVPCILFSKYRLIPVRIIGIVAGLICMLVLYGYQRFVSGGADDKEPEDEDEDTKEAPGPLDMGELARALSPWIILVALAMIISHPSVDGWLTDLPGDMERFTVFADQRVDLNALREIYTWIFVATLLSLPFLRPTREQLSTAVTNWKNRVLQPLIAYSVYFAIAFVMANSAKVIAADGALVAGPNFAAQNMNLVVADTLAGFFGSWYVLAAAFLGLFGALVGGSETGSNVMFMGIQRNACSSLGLDESFMTVFGSHAAAGGVASAITPAKINNAVMVLGESSEMEAEVMGKHFALVIVLTTLIGLMTGLFVMYAI